MAPPQKDLIMPYEDFPFIILYLCPAFVFFSFYYKSLQIFYLFGFWGFDSPSWETLRTETMYLLFAILSSVPSRVLNTE